MRDSSSHSRCRSLVATTCMHPVVSPTKDRVQPTSDQCAQCKFYSGPMRGLGDVVAAATRLSGIDRVVPRNCKCAERRAALNQIVPFDDKTSQER